uniref:Uncharacterized protein n=1 Tax=Arundo donax TaxID=35708 RepID=A0A0A9G386_ARUDO
MLQCGVCTSIDPRLLPGWTAMHRHCLSRELHPVCCEQNNIQEAQMDRLC